MLETHKNGAQDANVTMISHHSFNRAHTLE